MDLNPPKLEVEPKIEPAIVSVIIEPTHVSVTMDLKSPKGEAEIEIGSDLATRTIEATNFLSVDIESPKEAVPSEAAEEDELASITEQTRPFSNFDFNSVGSESDFPELPPFKNIPFIPRTPQKALRNIPTTPAAQCPPTPNTTPARRLKRPASTLDSPSRNRLFKKSFQKSSKNSLLTSRAPPFSIFYEIRNKSTSSISALEFDRVVESVLQQVDWKVVAEHVASNRPTGVFRRVILNLLKEKADLLKKEQEQRT